MMGGFINYAQDNCDGVHTPKQIGFLENKMTGEVVKVFKCACCGVKWKESNKGVQE